MTEPKANHLAIEERNKEQEVIFREGDRSSFVSDDIQNGAKEMEAISRTWSRWGLISAYAG